MSLTLTNFSHKLDFWTTRQPLGRKIEVEGSVTLRVHHVQLGVYLPVTSAKQETVFVIFYTGNP
jgi:hypothetical protein